MTSNADGYPEGKGDGAEFSAQTIPLPARTNPAEDTEKDTNELDLAQTRAATLVTPPRARPNPSAAHSNIRNERNRRRNVWTNPATARAKRPAISARNRFAVRGTDEPAGLSCRHEKWPNRIVLGGRRGVPVSPWRARRRSVFGHHDDAGADAEMRRDHGLDAVRQDSRLVGGRGGLALDTGSVSTISSVTRCGSSIAIGMPSYI